MQFPGARGTVGEKVGRPKNFSPQVCNFFTFYALANQTPTDRKSGNAGVLGHFGLGRPWALGKIPGEKYKNTDAHIEAEKTETHPLQLSPNTQS